MHTGAHNDCRESLLAPESLLASDPLPDRRTACCILNSRARSLIIVVLPDTRPGSVVRHDGVRHYG